MVPMISRNMLIALQDREYFLINALTPMSFFGVKTAMLYVFRNPVEYNIEKGWEFPNTIYLVARQDGERVEVFEEYINEVSLEKCGFSEEGSARYQHQPSVFCLQSGSTQYGVFSVEITPEEVDMVYLISIQMANALMAYHTEKKRLSVQRERELLLEELRSKNEILYFVLFVFQKCCDFLKSPPAEPDILFQIPERNGKLRFRFYCTIKTAFCKDYPTNFSQTASISGAERDFWRKSIAIVRKIWYTKI